MAVVSGNPRLGDTRTGVLSFRHQILGGVTLFMSVYLLAVEAESAEAIELSQGMLIAGPRRVEDGLSVIVAGLARQLPEASRRPEREDRGLGQQVAGQLPSQ